MSNLPNIDRLLSEAYAAHQARHLDVAERLYRRVLEQDPDDTDAANLLGLLYIETGKFATARKVIEQAIAIQPDNPHSHYNIGIAAKECGDSAAALHHFQESARLAPANVDAWVALGNMQKLVSQFADAADTYRQALTIDRSHLAARAGLSAALNDAGVQASEQSRFDEALTFYHEAIEIDSSNAKAALNAGMLLEQLGDGESAEKYFEAAVHAKPGLADAHFQLAHLKQHATCDADIKAMEALFKNAEQTTESKALLAYGLGKAWEKLAGYEQEFDWLRQAHELMAAVEPYERERTIARFDSIQQVFTTDLAGRPDTESGSNLIFVIGMPRSGTSLVEQILSSHPDVFGAGEQMTASKAIRLLRKRHGNNSYPAQLKDLTQQDLEVISTEICDPLTQLADGRSRVVDTTPSNFEQLGFIALLFPRARFIHCTRHPLDICLSIYQHPLSVAHAYAHDLDSLAAYYVGYRHLMRHWQAILPGRIFEQRYDRAIDDLEGSVRALLEFLELTFDPACLEFHKTQRVVKTPSASQVRQPIYSSSVGRWKRYAEQLAPLKNKLEQGLGVSLD